MKNTTMWLHIPIARENVIVVALGRASPLDYRRYQWKPRANISTLGESVPGVADQAFPCWLCTCWNGGRLPAGQKGMYIK